MSARYRRGRITTPEWVAEFVTDGRVRKSDPQLAFMVGWTDDEVRNHVRAKGWRAARVETDLDRAEKKPLVQAILEAFPGSVIWAVREPAEPDVDEAPDMATAA